MRQASPAVLRLSEWAYAQLLRAYPASFRAEFGGEMALLFSDCCRDEWRSAGAAGVSCLLARVVLDALVSAPPLWVERLEEAMNGDLRFESHERSTYVTRGSLERSLSAAGV